MDDTWIIRDDVVGMTAFFESARNGFSRTLKYTNDTDVGLFVRIGVVVATLALATEGAARALHDAGEYLVAMHGDASIFGRDWVAFAGPRWFARG